jgi:hypothetical protein
MYLAPTDPVGDNNSEVDISTADDPNTRFQK